MSPVESPAYRFTMRVPANGDSVSPLPYPCVLVDFNLRKAASLYGPHILLLRDTAREAELP